MQVQCVAFTVDGSYLVSVGNYRENALVLWNMSDFSVHTVAKVGEVGIIWVGRGTWGMDSKNI